MHCFLEWPSFPQQAQFTPVKNFFLGGTLSCPLVPPGHPECDPGADGTPRQFASCALIMFWNFWFDIHVISRVWLTNPLMSWLKGFRLVTPVVSTQRTPFRDLAPPPWAKTGLSEKERERKTSTKNHRPEQTHHHHHHHHNHHHPRFLPHFPWAHRMSVTWTDLCSVDQTTS